VVSGLRGQGHGQAGGRGLIEGAFNNRKPMDDAQRFSYVIRKIIGKRLTFDELTGKERPEAD
jgi:hypothetical protein